MYLLNIIKKIKKDYQKKKKKNLCERYQNLPEVEKEKKRQYGCERYRNLCEYEKN